jgi:hypothetical protein
MDSIWYELGTWLMRLGFVAITLFTIRYGTSSPWWQTHAGIALFLRNVAIVFVIGLTVTYGFFGFWPGFFVARFFVFGGFALSAVWFYIVYEMNKRGKLASPPVQDDGYVVYREEPQETVRGPESDSLQEFLDSLEDDTEEPVEGSVSPVDSNQGQDIGPSPESPQKRFYGQ